MSIAVANLVQSSIVHRGGLCRCIAMAVLLGGLIPTPSRAEAKSASDEGKPASGEGKSGESSLRDVRKKVRKLHEDGLMHYNLGEYEEALEAFTNAYRLRQDPVFLFNIAQTYRQMNIPQKAAQTYRAYLRMRPDAPNRAAVERFIADAEASIKALEANRPPTGVEPPTQDRPGPTEPRAEERTPQVASPSPGPGTMPAAPRSEYPSETAGAPPPPAILPGQGTPPPGPAVAYPQGSDPRASGAAAGPAGTYVTLQARSSRATLYRRWDKAASGGAESGPGTLPGTGPRARWQVACGAPCGFVVDRQASYRIAGPGITPSRAFHLPAAVDRVEIQARTGSRGVLAAGVTLLSLGIASLVSAPILWTNPYLEYYGVNQSSALTTALVGVPLVAVGLPLVIVGTTRLRLRGIDSEGRVQIPVGRHAALTPTGLVF